ncbi:hypothetical protein V8F33_012116 [Rhypophila sp. PSN 637]
MAEFSIACSSAAFLENFQPCLRLGNLGCYRHTIPATQEHHWLLSIENQQRHQIGPALSPSSSVNRNEAARYYGIKPQRCPVCDKTLDLVHCRECNVVSYCSAAHRTLDRSRHQGDCDRVKQAREKLDEEEAILRANPENAHLPNEVFENSIGAFNTIPRADTHAYMTARVDYAGSLGAAQTWISLERALMHYLALMDLDRRDGLRCRDIVPAVMAQLGRETECYGFLKWCATDVQDDPADLDPFESLDPFRQVDEAEAKEAGDTNVCNACSSWSNSQGDQCQIHRQPGPIVQSWLEKNQNNREIKDMLARVSTQFEELCDMIQTANPYFWETLTDTDWPTEPAEDRDDPRAMALLQVMRCKYTWRDNHYLLCALEDTTAKYARVYITPDTGDIPTPANRRLVLISLEHSPHFDHIYKNPLLTLTLALQHDVERVTTRAQYRDALQLNYAPSIILVAETSVARINELFGPLADCLRTGSTVVVFGAFSFGEPSIIKGRWARFFAKLGLPWTRGGYHEATTHLHRQNVGPELAGRLPEIYNQKAYYLNRVDRSAAWYSRPAESTEVAAAVVSVGKGKLCYVGDSGGANKTTSVIMAMCGLL